MKEQPIIFSGSMVKAILDGRKTQTRRVIKPQPTMMDDDRRRLSVLSDCPYRSGDHLWVRETWICEGKDQPGQGLHYRANACEADEKWFKEENWKWRSSIHMPRWASRLTIEVMKIRVERVQDITEEDAEAEGIIGDTGGDFGDREYIIPFADLWDSLNAKRGYSWKSNPLVWVIEFRKIE